MTSIKIISKQDFEKKFGKSNQEEVWNSIASPWKEYRKKAVPIVEEFLKNKKGLIIDLGCGSGRNMIKQPYVEYYGIDFSKNQLKSAEQHIKKNKIDAHSFISKIEKLNKKIFKNEMFDYGLFIATLHCIESEKQRENALKEFYRVLKKGAEGLISVWNSEDKRFLSIGNHGDIYMSWKKDEVLYMRYYYLFDKNEFIDLIEIVGFKILEFYSPREGNRFSRKNWIVKVKK